ncbi:GNAT family N-acetyltransferase [Embleya sp. NBC_00896]|uniref:GNAT family N-acetyltransferase n=1 Tax=Embleya sp. NBC_00896 TaxID=2975961 RepID=UPI002F90BAF5|nr:GNAT family N-acetyltransferase [Embleya sp. NBC_00896]
MYEPAAVTFRQYSRAHDVDAPTRDALVECWVAVTNAGGAAGFPFPPVTAAEVAPVAERLIADLDPARSRLLVAVADKEPIGWLNVRRGLDPLIAHWGTLHHVQTRPDVRGRGIGAALARGACAMARDDMGLEQLRLTARAGMGLEDFYGRLGWKEIGRWPGALRFGAGNGVGAGDGDDRDEILMILTL